MKKSNILEAKIKQAAQQYYEGKPTITDEQFDVMVEELKEVKPDSVNLKTGWGYEVDANNKVKHAYTHVGSLDKVKDVEVLNKKLSTKVVTPKLDGASCVLYYHKGVLTHALTRGDGTYGEDVTSNVLEILNKYSLNVSKDFTGAIRGEVAFTRKLWQEYLAHDKDAKFPRNVSTGLLSRKAVSPLLKYVSFVAYKVTASNIKIKSYVDSLVLLNSWKFHTVHNYTFNASMTTEQLVNAYFEWSQQFFLDGLVVNSGKLNATNVKELFALECDKEIAFKFQAESKITKVTEIEWNLTKNNKLVPVVHVEPVELSGATVRKVTAFNCSFIVQNCIGIDSTIELTRSGEVIPYILRVESTSPNNNIPKVCPACGSQLFMQGVDLRCSYAECPNILQSRLATWVEKIGCRNLLGVGPALLSSFMEYLGTVDLGNVYEKLNANALKPPQECFTPANAEKVKRIITNLKTPVPFNLLLEALNIEGLGATNCAKIAKTLQENLFLDEQLLYSKLKTIEGIGEYVTSAVIQGLSTIRYTNTLVTVETPLTEQTRASVVVSGGLSVPRNVFEQLCKDNGISVVTSFSKASYLVCNDPTVTSSKIEKAKQLGTPIVSEEEFLKLFNLSIVRQ